MRLIFSQHATNQLEERKISRRAVGQTIHKPHRLIPQSPIRFRAVRFISKARKRYLLVVIYDQERGALEIVTAFITSKIEKYL